jgi:hypothetical protein
MTTVEYQRLHKEYIYKLSLRQAGLLDNNAWYNAMHEWNDANIAFYGIPVFPNLK